jgi:putative hemolysin
MSIRQRIRKLEASGPAEVKPTIRSTPFGFPDPHRSEELTVAEWVARYCDEQGGTER